MSNILFLQGPLGPFFGKLANRFSTLGNKTFKINFNGGDAFFADADHVYDYRGSLKSWSRYLSMFVRRNQIHAIVVYGDCRQYHSIAKDICNRGNIEFWAFEEGYIRPNFITLEKGGVNANSEFRINSKAHAVKLSKAKPAQKENNEYQFGQTFFQRLYYGIAYYLSKSIAQYWLINDAHHRQYSAVEEGKFWLKSIRRKWKYKFSQRELDSFITQNYSGRYFFVPLQVHCDSQILAHSDFSDVNDFIRTVMLSFSLNASKGDILVFKHHPMDRGFRHYGTYIRRLAALLNITERVIYGHEMHLPSMLKHCKATITVNSTVGLSSLHHNKPTKVLGRAHYDIPGLTSMQPLDSFWQQPTPVDSEFFAAYKQALKQHTQINGSFYRHIDFTCEQVVRYLQENQGKMRARKPNSVSSHSNDGTNTAAELQTVN